MNRIRQLAAVIVVVLVCLSSVAKAVPIESGFYVPTWDGSSSTGGSVLRFDSRGGSFVNTVVGPLANDIIQGMTLGPDGLLYAVAFDTRTNVNPRILRYDLSGNFVDEFIGPGDAIDGGLGFPDGLGVPVGIRFGPDGNLYVTANAPGSDEILRYDGRTGEFIDVFATGLTTPQDILFGPDGLLYVSNGNAFESSVFRFDVMTGQFVDEFIATGSGGLSAPTGMAFGRDENLYVASFPNNSVMRFDGNTGDFIDTFLSLDGLGSNTLTDLVFGPDGDLYVNGRNDSVPGGGTAIYRFDGRTGAFVDEFIGSDQGLGVLATGMLFVDRACARYRDRGGLGNRCFARVPEPGTLALLGIGLLGMGAARRRKKA